MKPGNKNSYKSLTSIRIGEKEYNYFSLKIAETNVLKGIEKLPKSLKVLLENLLRYEDDKTVTKDQILALQKWLKDRKSETEIAYRPARVLLQDYTGIPAVADLAAMREAVKEKNIAGVVSQVLILGAIDQEGKVVLLPPSQKTEDGLPVA